MSAGLGIDVGAGVMTVTLHVPATRNALSLELLAGIADALRAADPALRGAVLTGAGGLFSAGADFNSLTGTEADVRYDDAVADVVAAVWSCPWPVVAAIEGGCLGAAADIALACDFRVLADDAFLEIPAARLRIVYNPQTIRRLHRRYPDEALRRLFLLGERMTAAQVLAAGLGSHVVPHGQAAQTARAMLAGAPDRSAAAVAAMRAVLNDPDAPADAGTWIDAERRRLLSTHERRTSIEQRQRPPARPQDHDTPPGA